MELKKRIKDWSRVYKEMDEQPKSIGIGNLGKYMIRDYRYFPKP